MNTALLRSKYFWINLFLILLIGWGIFRGCSSLNHSTHRSVFKIGRDSTWYPVQLFGKERNLVAFSNELLVAIAKEMDLHIEITSTGASGLMEGLDNGNFDGILSALPPTSHNMDHYLFSDPFFLIGPLLVVKEDSNIHSLEELNGKTVAVKIGSPITYILAKDPDVIVVPYESMIIALDSVDKSRIDGVIMDALPAYAYTQGFYAGKLKIATPPLTDEGFRVVSRQGSKMKDFMEVYNEGLKKLKANGVYKALGEKWGL